MNKSKIEWCDHTWNPITGCRHNCQYCYARRITARFAGDVRLNKMAKADYQMVDAANGSDPVYCLEKPMLNETGKPLVYPFGFEPTYHRYRMGTLDKLKMGNNIFVGAMSDMFGEWVPEEWIKEILDVCMAYPIHNYLFLTKNPDRYINLLMKDQLPESNNMWYGVTVTNSQQAWIAEATMQDLPGTAHAFLSIEPLLSDLSGNESLEIVIANFTDWVIIGAETGRRKSRVVPRREWIENIVKQCDEFGVPVFMKNSLIPIIGENNMRVDFPEQLRHSEISPKMKKKLFDLCAECNTNLKKSDMITLLARSKRGEQPKQFGFLCKKCFKKQCEKWGIEVPDLEEMED